GLAVARRRRFSDGDVALYLDARLGSEEAIATALTLDVAGPTPARDVVIEHAEKALAAATPKQVRPRFLHAAHAAIPIAAAGIAYLSMRPLPAAPAAPPPPPGAERVKLSDVRGLEKIEQLGALDGRDEAQKKRLEKLAADAKKLREKLKDGMEKREALAEIGRLKDGITAERMSLGDGEERAGLEAAASKLGENPSLKKAEKALGDHDVTTFDQEMERLANRLEKEDREKAKKTLEEAAEAAKKNGAKGVADELERQKELLDQRGKKADALKELAKELGDGLSDEGKQALRDFERHGARKDEKKLEKHLEDALEKLSPEERKRLAENMKKKIASMGDDAVGPGPSKEQMKEMLRQLETDEGQKQLEDELRKMAEDDESKREEKLDDAQEGAGETEGQIGGAPIPIPMQADGSGKGESGKGAKGDAGDKGNGSPGHSDDAPSHVDHEGMTGVVEGGDVKSRANARMNKGKALPGIVMGRTAARPGETANVQGTGALGQVAPTEVGGVERSDVPEEYREQVGRYFQPK
ncbi:MAG TPA: hypothetical protein VHB21_03990, partial [Minicystis sp.]|nr:hypothetical protein [Minicystis sp.]